MGKQDSKIELSQKDREINRKRIEKTRKGFFGFFILRWRLVILLVIGMAAWGTIALFQLPKEANPEVQIPIAVVMTVYPGASPADVEELVTREVEDALDGLGNVSLMTSNSSFGASSVVVEFEAEADLKESIRALRDQVDSIRGLPGEAEDPMVIEIRANDFAVITFSLVGDLTDQELKDLGERAQDELESINGVSRVALIGAREREFAIELAPAKMARLGIDINQVVRAIQLANMNFPLGTVEVDGTRYNLRVMGEIGPPTPLARLGASGGLRSPRPGSGRVASRATEELKKIVVKNIAGSLVFLGDIARVEDHLKEKTTVSRISLNQGPLQNVVSLQVYKKTGGNLIEVADKSLERLEEMKENGLFPEGVEIEVVSDVAEYARESINTLGRSGIQTFILIFILLGLALAIRQAAIAALAVPLIFLGTFGVLNMQGQTLNGLTMFSLVLSLGLLVDTLIIVLEGLHDNLMQGYSPQESALLSVGTFKWPLIAGVMTTICAFVPMFLVSGIMGEFLVTLPLTISATLGISLLVALVIIPSLAAVVVRKKVSSNRLELSSNISNNVNDGSGDDDAFSADTSTDASGKLKLSQMNPNNSNSDSTSIRDIREELEEIRGGVEKEHLMEKYFTRPLQRRYRGFIRNLLRSKKKRRILMVSIFVAFVISITLLVRGVVPIQMFAGGDSDYFAVSVELPNGSVLEETEEVVQKIERKLLKISEIKNFVTNVGGGGSLAFTGIGAGGGGTSEHLAALTVNLVDPKERKRKSYEISKELRMFFEEISQAKIMIAESHEGPPTGAAVEVRVTGDDLGVLDKIAGDIKEELESIQGAIEIDTNIRTSPPEFGFRLKHEELGRYNLSAAQVSSTLRSVIYGAKASEITMAGEDIDIVVRYPEDAVDMVMKLKNLEIITPTGAAVSLSQVADFELTPALESISHRDMKRIVSVTAKNEEGVPPNQIFAELQEKLENYEMPEGYEIIYGGEMEQLSETFAEIGQAMIVAVLLILLILILEFDSFKQPIIIMVSLPAAMIGVVLGLLILDLEFGFAAFLGLVGLAGIVVNDAIVLIDRINNNIKEREMELVEAISEAGEARLQPIFLTTVTTIAGILPLYFADEFWQGLSIAMVFGLAFSTVLTLTLVPVLYRWLEGKKRGMRHEA